MEYSDRDQVRLIWPEWEIINEIGRGAYGTVYKAVRRDLGIESYSAIKVIAIPRNQSELHLLLSEGLDEQSSRKYLYNLVMDFVNEIRLMESLKGVQNIVSIEDYRVIEKKDELGWLIFIRMELLTPFVDYLLQNRMNMHQVLQLGIDMCSALEMCERKEIIHRDIKPDNVFVSDLGSFKLGDFGIARRMEGLTHGLSQKGTFNYMAPEVAMGKSYDSRVDIYSLGVMLYKLLNNNHLPFIDSEEQLLDVNYKRLAVEKRMRGDEFPPPAAATPELSRIILKASAFSPEDRYSSAAEMKSDLLAVQINMGREADVLIDGYSVGGNTSEAYWGSQSFENDDGISKTVNIADLADGMMPYAGVGSDPGIGKINSGADLSNQVSADIVNTGNDRSKKIKKLIPVIAAAAAAVLLLGAAGVAAAFLLRDSTSSSEPPIVVTEAAESESEIETAADTVTERLPETEADKSEETGSDDKDRELSIQNVLGSAEKYAAKSDYSEACNILNTFISHFGTDPRLESKLEEYSELLKEAEPVTEPEPAGIEISIPLDQTDTQTPQETVPAAPSVSEIRIKTKPNKLIYTVGENFSPAGMTITAKYSDGTTKTVNYTECDCVSDLSKTGERTITVIYGGKSTYFDVTVKEKEITQIIIDKSEYSLGIGDTLSLQIKVLPGDAKDKIIKLTSSNTSVVSVSGLTIKAEGKGTAVITAASSNGVKTTCKVTVWASEVTEVKVSPKSFTLNAGESRELSVNLMAVGNSYDNTITAVSDNPSVARVNGFTVTGVSGGEATITLSAVNGVSATCKVKVVIPPIDSISLARNVNINLNSSYTLKPNISPIGASSNSVRWSTSNSKIAKVDSYGKVTGVGLGTCVITVSAADDDSKKASCTVTVSEVQVKSIDIPSSFSLAINESATLTAAVSPGNAANKSLSWSVSDSSILSVAQDGKITGKKAGTATVIVKAVNGVSASCTVTVTSEGRRSSDYRYRLSIIKEPTYLNYSKDSELSFTGLQLKCGMYEYVYYSDHVSELFIKDINITVSGGYTVKRSYNSYGEHLDTVTTASGETLTFSYSTEQSGTVPVVIKYKDSSTVYYITVNE